VAETTYTPFSKRGTTFRLIVRRVRPTPGSQLALFTEFTLTSTRLGLTRSARLWIANPTIIEKSWDGV
jgi:hypothetical protein